MGFPKIRGSFFRGPHSKDYSILKSIFWVPLGFPPPSAILGNYQILNPRSHLGVHFRVERVSSSEESFDLGGFPKPGLPFLGPQNKEYGILWIQVLGNCHLFVDRECM